MTSNDLEQTQQTLETLAKQEIESPMTNYSKLNRLLKVIQEVDKNRRKLCNEETFGEYDKITEIFCSDDIPF